MKTDLVKLTGDSSNTAAIAAAAKILDQGGLVAFPTETVYGIGSRARTDSIKLLDDVKQRGPEKCYTLHIGDKCSLGKYVPNTTPGAGKLISRAWPGPVTVVFELDDSDIQKPQGLIDTQAFEILYQNRTIGVRCPDNPLAQALLNQTKMPIVATSANIAGKSPATDAKQVIEDFNGKIDMILDGGDWAPCKYKKNSTIVKITHKNLEILRQGVYSDDEINSLSTINILFVCTGNTCRSPLAEGFCRKYIAEKLDCPLDETTKKGYKIISAGVMAFPGMSASSESIDICRENGVDISGHRSRLLNAEDLEASDCIFVMGKGHYNSVLQISPGSAEKCKLLDTNADIPDPIGQGIEMYRQCAKRIEHSLELQMNGIL